MKLVGKPVERRPPFAGHRLEWQPHAQIWTAEDTVGVVRKEPFERVANVVVRERECGRQELDQPLGDLGDDQRRDHSASVASAGESRCAIARNVAATVSRDAAGRTRPWSSGASAAISDDLKGSSSSAISGSVVS